MHKATFYFQHHDTIWPYTSSPWPIPWPSHRQFFRFQSSTHLYFLIFPLKHNDTRHRHHQSSLSYRCLSLQNYFTHNKFVGICPLFIKSYLESHCHKFLSNLIPKSWISKLIMRLFIQWIVWYCIKDLNHFNFAWCYRVGLCTHDLKSLICWPCFIKITAVTNKTCNNYSPLYKVALSCSINNNV